MDKNNAVVMWGGTKNGGKNETQKGLLQIKNFVENHNHSFIHMPCTECDDSLPFSGASSIPLCYVLFPATLLHQLFVHTLSPHLAIYFMVYLSNLSFPNSYIMLFWEFYFLPFSVHAQTNTICLNYCLYYSRIFNSCINFFIG
jgi:hypothetical protein